MNVRQEKRKRISRVARVLRDLAISFLAVLIIAQVGIAGVRLFYDVKYHRPARIKSYILFNELVPGKSPAKLDVTGASWREKNIIVEAYRSIDLPLDKVLDRPVRVVLTDSKKVVQYGQEKVDAAGYYNPGKDLVVLVRHRGVAPGVDDVEYYRSTLGHEIMHVLDYRYLTDADRDEYLRMRGLAGVSWGGNGTRAMGGWAATPAEDWAETASTLMSSGKIGGPETTLGSKLKIDSLRDFIRDRIGV